MKHYLGFAVCIEEKETGILFKRKKQKEVLRNLRVEVNSFAEAQDMVCDKIPLYKMTVAFIFPFTEEDMK